MALSYSNTGTDFKLDGVFKGNYKQAIADFPPNITHFVHTEVKELT